MSDFWLSVVIPTVGRVSLGRTLDSLDGQPEADGLEVLVVADTYGGGLTPDQRRARDEIWERRDAARYLWLEYDGGLHCYGHPQRTAGARTARAPYVWFSQDDNIAAAGALEAIRVVIAEQDRPRPLFFRWRSPWQETIWRTQQLYQGNIDADCLVLPRPVAERVTWGLRYEGDFDAAAHAFQLAHGDVAWCEPVISIARPGPAEYWWRDAA